MPMYVFAYGTLRAGEINDLAVAAARRGLAPPRRVGAGTVRGTLYDFGDWPGLVPDAGGLAIAGDVYEIDDALLALMDEIEEYDPAGGSCFLRRRTRVAVAGAELDCYYYPIDPARAGRARRTGATDWVAYRRQRPKAAGGAETAGEAEGAGGADTGGADGGGAGPRAGA